VHLLGISDDLHYYDNYPPMFKLDQQPKFGGNPSASRWKRCSWAKFPADAQGLAS
jgi:hypothetical protein